MVVTEARASASGCSAFVPVARSVVPFSYESGAGALARYRRPRRHCGGL